MKCLKFSGNCTKECQHYPCNVLKAYQKGRAGGIDELADYVLNQFAPLFTKEELIKQFKEQNNNDNYE